MNLCNLLLRLGDNSSSSGGDLGERVSWIAELLFFLLDFILMGGAYGHSSREIGTIPSRAVAWWVIYDSDIIHFLSKQANVFLWFM